MSNIKQKNHLGTVKPIVTHFYYSVQCLRQILVWMMILIIHVRILAVIKKQIMAYFVKIAGNHWYKNKLYFKFYCIFIV